MLDTIVRISLGYLIKYIPENCIEFSVISNEKFNKKTNWKSAKHQTLRLKRERANIFFVAVNHHFASSIFNRNLSLAIFGIEEHTTCLYVSLTVHMHISACVGRYFLPTHTHRDIGYLKWFEKTVNRESDIFTFFPGKKERDPASEVSLSLCFVFLWNSTKEWRKWYFYPPLICLFLTACFATWTSPLSDFSSLGRYYQLLPVKALRIIIMLLLGLF